MAVSLGVIATVSPKIWNAWIYIEHLLEDSRVKLPYARFSVSVFFQIFKNQIQLSSLQNMSIIDDRKETATLHSDGFRLRILDSLATRVNRLSRGGEL